MKTNNLLFNCISEAIERSRCKRMLVFGSKNLEIECYVSESTSLPIFGCDVDFF